MTDTLKVAFIKARWHADIVDQALKGFEADMAAAGRKVAISTYDVPGALEMPLLAKKLGETGRFDGIVAAALVVDGGIYRHDFVAQAVVCKGQTDTAARRVAGSKLLTLPESETAPRRKT